MTTTRRAVAEQVADLAADADRIADAIADLRRRINLAAARLDRLQQQLDSLAMQAQAPTWLNLARLGGPVSHTGMPTPQTRRASLPDAQPPPRRHHPKDER